MPGYGLAAVQIGVPLRLAVVDASGMARGMVVGSIARNTWTSGDHDLDIFMLFDPSMPREELERVQLRRLQALCERVYANVPFYKKKFDEKGIKPQDIKTLKDITLLPFTAKQDLRDQYPFGLFSVPKDQIVRIHSSSGTTGTATVVGYTKRDIENWGELMARCFMAAGASASDTVHNAYGYGLFTGGLGAHYGAEALGATVVPISGGATRRQVLLLKDFMPAVFIQDPALLKDFSRKYRIATLLEVLLLAIEGYFSNDSTYFSDTLMLRGLGLAIDTLPEMLKRPDEVDVVFRAQQAGFFTGFGLSMSSPGWGTASAYILGSLLQVPPPIVATVLLPYVLEYGLKVCPEKVARMGNILGENLKGLSVVAAADRVVESIRASLGVEQLPGRLSELGVRDNHLSQTVSRVMEGPFIDSLPGNISFPELSSFLENAL